MSNGNMVKRKIQNEEGIRPAFNNPQIYRADRDTGLTIHQEECEQTKQE